MGCFFSFLTMIVLVAVLLALTSQYQSRVGVWNRSYQSLAKRYGGTFVPAGWYGRPSTRFTYATTQVLINSVASGRRGDFTQIHIDWHDPDLRLEMFPRGQASDRRPPRGTHEITLGYAEFDETFIVFGSNDDAARSFLTDGVRWQIDRLLHLFDRSGIYLSVQRGRMLIKKPSHIKRYEQLEEFTHMATQLYDQAMLSRAVGIQFVNHDEVQAITEAICQICGENITTQMVVCRRCKTPHHDDCWEYYGSCAVYGCGETKREAPKAAGPPPESSTP